MKMPKYTKKNYIKKLVQLGWTEAIANDFIGWLIQRNLVEIKGEQK